MDWIQKNFLREKTFQIVEMRDTVVLTTLLELQSNSTINS